MTLPEKSASVKGPRAIFRDDVPYESYEDYAVNEALAVLPGLMTKRQVAHALRAMFHSGYNLHRLNLGTDFPVDRANPLPQKQFEEELAAPYPGKIIKQPTQQKDSE